VRVLSRIIFGHCADYRLIFFLSTSFFLALLTSLSFSSSESSYPTAPNSSAITPPLIHQSPKVKHRPNEASVHLPLRRRSFRWQLRLISLQNPHLRLGKEMRKTAERMNESEGIGNKFVPGRKRTLRPVVVLEDGPGLTCSYLRHPLS
jgi:hypothetical protein